MKYQITLTEQELKTIELAMKFSHDCGGNRNVFQTRQAYNLMAKLQKRDKAIEEVEAEIEQMEIGG